MRLVLLIVAALTVAMSAGAAAADARRGVDTVLTNGFVYTVDDRNSVARALAIERGKIVYVGSNKGARRFVDRNTEVIDLKGRMVMPGLHDGHIHDVTKSDQPTCDLEAAPLTVPELQARVQACLNDPALGSEPNDFLIVENLYMQFLRPAGTAPHKSMLDALPTRRPIVVSAAVTGHTTLVNQNALNLAGITRDTPDPEGGRIDRDPNGEPNGLLQDAAAGLVRSKIPPPPPVSDERRVALARERMREFSREGITSFFVPGAPADTGTIKTFQALRDAGGLTARPHFAIRGSFAEMRKPGPLYARVERMRRDLEHPDQIPLSVRSWRPGRQRGPRLVAKPGISIDGVKFFLDGIAQFPAQTAAMLEPYLDAQGKPRTDASARGELFADADILGPVVTELERRGFQSHVHAIGDRAVRVALDAFQAARKANPRIRARQTIAHAEVTHPDDYRRFGKYDVVASMGLQWAKPAPDSTEAVKPFLGPFRRDGGDALASLRRARPASDSALAVRTFQRSVRPYLTDRWDLYEPTVPIERAGGTVSLGSDCCLDPFDEWFDLEVSILREADWGPEFPQFAGKLNALPGLSLRDAIRVVTINGAYQMHQDEVTGSLEQGKLADLVVLDQNITKVPLDDISNTDVLLTMVGGRKVWADPAL